MKSTMMQCSATRCALAVAVVLTGPATSAAAQQRGSGQDSVVWTYTTTFERPPARPDSSQYQTVETCQAAVDRTRHKAEVERWLQTKLWRDSLPPEDPRAWPTFGGPGRLTALPDTVVAVARHCAQGLTVAGAVRDSGSVTDLIKVYLAANRDAEVTTLVTQQLAAMGVDTARQRAFTDSVLDVYQAAQPVRRDAAVALLEARLRATVGFRQIPVLARLSRVAEIVGDTAGVRARSQQIVNAWQQLPTAVHDSLRWAQDSAPQPLRGTAIGIFSDVYTAGDLVHRAVLLDSLRHSTAAYARAEKALVGRVSTDVGDTAPNPIVARDWVGQTPGDSVRPRLGHVELVVELWDNWWGLCGGFARGGVQTVEWGPSAMEPNCVKEFAAIRRLTKQFPELDVTLLVGGSGLLFQRAYGEADFAEEQATIRHWLRDIEHLPGTIWFRAPPNPMPRRPAPDRRVVTPRLQAFNNYGNETLIGRDGLIITLGGLATQEAGLRELIAAALQQPK